MDLLTYEIYFTKTRGIISLLVRWFTWGKYSHVVIAKGGVAIEADPFKGVREIALRKVLEEATAYKHYKIMGSRLVWAFLQQQVGKGYDWAGIVAHVARWRKIQWRDAWTCSELIASAFEFADQPLLRGDPSRVTPETLRSSRLLQFIGEKE